MSIGSGIGRQIERQAAVKAARRGASTVQREVQQETSKALTKSRPLLKLVLGSGWTDFITRSPLEENLRDVGPEWLTSISKRLDGKKREAVGLSIKAGVYLPTPVPGLTLLANGATEATLRRTPKGVLELVYATEIDPGIAAQLRIGLSGGFTAGPVALKGGAMAQAGIHTNAIERATLVYEFNPRNGQEMTRLATQLKTQLYKDRTAVKGALGGGTFLSSLKQVFTGKVQTPKVPVEAPVLKSDFARTHLTQASFFQGVRVGGSVNVWGGLSFSRDGAMGFSGHSNGVGFNWKGDLSARQVPTNVEKWQQLAGAGLDFFNSILTPHVGVSTAFDVGIERTLDFDRGKYLKTTFALNSDRNLLFHGGAYGLVGDQLVGKGHRYAVTVGPNGLQGVDYSVRMEIGDGIKQQKALEKQLDRKISPLLPANRKEAPLVATYSLKPEALKRLQQLDPQMVDDELAKLFKDKDAFQLSRLLSSHGDRFAVGGWIGVGMGPFVGLRAEVAAEHGEVAMRLGKHQPADPLPADRPWTLRQF